MMVLWDVVKVSGKNVEWSVWYNRLNMSPAVMIIGDERSLSRGLSSGEITEMDPRNTCGSSTGGRPDPFGKFEIWDTPINSR